MIEATIVIKSSSYARVNSIREQFRRLVCFKRLGQCAEKRARRDGNAKALEKQANDSNYEWRYETEDNNSGGGSSSSAESDLRSTRREHKKAQTLLARDLMHVVFF